MHISGLDAFLILILLIYGLNGLLTFTLLVSGISCGPNVRTAITETRERLSFETVCMLKKTKRVAQTLQADRRPNTYTEQLQAQ